MKNILITGASGYIGPYVCREFEAITGKLNLTVNALYNNHLPDVTGVSLVKCDLMDSGALENVFRQVNPDTVIHLASGTPTRTIGADEQYIRQFNFGVTKKIAELCKAAGSLLIYTSTDLVYADGVDIREDEAELEPLTIYAKTKLEGENVIRDIGPEHLILRTALVYGFTISTYSSFFITAYSALAKSETIKAFVDQYRNPLYIESAAKIISRLPSLYESNDTINFCGPEYLSRYEMCLGICEFFGFDKKLVIPSSCDEFTTYPMVKRLGLDNSKLTDLGLTTGTYKENLIKSLNWLPMNL
jgi:dTDP-4-dehydrorhamnose reductase